MGFEPTYIGITIRGLNRLTTSTMVETVEEDNRIELSPIHHKWDGFQDRVRAMQPIFHCFYMVGLLGNDPSFTG